MERTQPDGSYSPGNTPQGLPPSHYNSGEGDKPMGDRAREQASEMADRARSTAADVADKAEELAPQARERAYEAAESGRESSAGALDRAASGLEDRAARSEGMTGMAAERTAEGMHAAAGYLKQHETSEIWDDVEQYVRTHPVQAVAAAVVTGIVVGRVLR
jgi:ElaB/YqjD/DUF883 family membrane-anchored ribosome-binding protein